MIRSAPLLFASLVVVAGVLGGSRPGSAAEPGPDAGP
jgi:hypothetical protein